MLKFFMLKILTLYVSANADENYQKQIDKHFKGWTILSPKEFNSESIKATSPGLSLGDFNGDKIPDFAALVRNSNNGKFVMCHGQKNNDYKCQTLASMPFTQPQESYLASVKPQKTGCYNAKGEKNFIDVKTDAVGWFYPEKGASHYIFQPNGSYQNCVTAD